MRKLTGFTRNTPAFWFNAKTPIQCASAQASLLLLELLLLLLELLLLLLLLEDEEGDRGSIEEGPADAELDRGAGLGFALGAGSAELLARSPPEVDCACALADALLASTSASVLTVPFAGLCNEDGVERASKGGMLDSTLVCSL